MPVAGRPKAPPTPKKRTELQKKRDRETTRVRRGKVKPGTLALTQLGVGLERASPEYQRLYSQGYKFRDYRVRELAKLYGMCSAGTSAIVSNATLAQIAGRYVLQKGIDSDKLSDIIRGIKLLRDAEGMLRSATQQARDEAVALREPQDQFEGRSLGDVLADGLANRSREGLVPTANKPGTLANSGEEGAVHRVPPWIDPECGKPTESIDTPGESSEEHLTLEQATRPTGDTPTPGE